jgi:hypothetical protein
MGVYGEEPENINIIMRDNLILRYVILAGFHCMLLLLVVILC